jgi:hypothetical protein
MICGFCEQNYTSTRSKFCSKNCQEKFKFLLKKKEKIKGPIPVERYIARLLRPSYNAKYLTKEFLLRLYYEQKGRCALSGTKMTSIVGKGYVNTNLSIDRIDSSRGYVENNIQLVCYIVNVMKRDLPVKDFQEICQQVAVNSKELVYAVI